MSYFESLFGSHEGKRFVKAEVATPYGSDSFVGFTDVKPSETKVLSPCWKCDLRYDYITEDEVKYHLEGNGLEEIFRRREFANLFDVRSVDIL